MISHTPKLNFPCCLLAVKCISRSYDAVDVQHSTSVAFITLQARFRSSELSPNFWLEILETFRFRWKGFFFHSFQTCNPIGKSWNLLDGTITAPDWDKKMIIKNFAQMDVNVSVRTGWIRWGTSEGRLYVPRDVRLIHAFICISRAWTGKFGQMESAPSLFILRNTKRTKRNVPITQCV